MTTVMDKGLVAWLSIGVLDLGVIWLLIFTLRAVSIKSVLREKDPNSQPSLAQTAALSAAQASNGQDATIAALANTSYSRLSGFIGSIILACFLWAASNYVIYASFYEPGAVADYVKSFGSYFLAGASLFAPYAVNQLSKVFKQ